MRILATGVAVLAMAASGFAATLKVPQQFPTIQEAVDAAVSGDTIKIGPGVYNESLVIEGRSGLRFLGSKGTIWESNSGEYTTALSLYGDGTLVKGIKFRNAYRGVYFEGNGNTVTKCTFVNTWEDAVESYGDDFVFTKNTVQGCYRGVRTYEGSRAVIVKNTFRQVYDAHVDVQGADGLVSGNTCSGYYSEGSVISVSGDSHEVTKNRVRNAYGMQIYASGSGVLISGNTLGNGYGGIYLGGSGGTIEGNRISTTYYYGIQVSGDSDTVVGNDAGISYYSALNISGNSNTITGNRLHDVTDDHGIAASGSQTLIEGNTVFGTLTFGIRSTGSGGTVRGNRVSDVWDSNGIEVSGIGSHEVVDNVVVNCIGAGIHVSGDGGDISRNTITGCATYYENALAINGNQNHIEGNRVSDSGTTGIYVTGSGNTLTDCIVTRATINGFHINGTDNHLAGCSATDGDGQGLNNQATLTEVLGSTFLRNAMDLANTGTFSSGTAGITFVTGGQEQAPLYFPYL